MLFLLLLVLDTTGVWVCVGVWRVGVLSTLLVLGRWFSNRNCWKELATSMTFNSMYAAQLISAKFAALEWDDL